MIGQRIESAHHGLKPGDAGRFLQLPGHRFGKRNLSVDQPTNVSAVRLALAGDPLDAQASGPDDLGHINSHVLKSVSNMQNCQGGESAESVKVRHNSRMAHWTYRDEWRDAYRAHKKKSGLDEPGMAKLLGTTIHSLANYKRPNGSIPDDSFLANAEAVFGLPTFSFRDNPLLTEALRGVPPVLLEQFQRTTRALDGLELPPDIIARLFDDLGASARAKAALLETGKKMRD